MDEDKRKAYNELVCSFDESMKKTLNILSEIFESAHMATLKLEPAPKKVVKKRLPKKVKTEVNNPTENSDILTLNVDAPIAAHHSGDKGTGQIEYSTLE